MSLSSHAVPAFTAHNILLGNGKYTHSADFALLEQRGWLVSAMLVLHMVFPSERERIDICDFGCLEDMLARLEAAAATLSPRNEQLQELRCPT